MICKTTQVGLIFSLLFFLACQSEKTEIENDGGPFTLLSSSQTGLDFSNTLKENDKQNIIEYLYYYNGGGVAVGDVDGDGLEDIFLTANQGPDALYLNNGNLQFENVSEASGIISENGWSSGVAMDDVNGDGHLDIYVSRVARFAKPDQAHNFLYINDGTGKFSEQSKQLGLDFSGYSTQSCFLDYDKDGDLDMYLLNHAVHTIRSYGNTEKRSTKDPVSGDRFYENRIKEEGRFVEVTEEAGIYNSPLGYGLAITAADINQDGWTDIYIGNDFHEYDYLYLNNGRGGFEESN
ncbi:MAG: VCBS repeat-containing protein, partial [Saprospiraceae bacterium]|nr:VCBS repeat-containing protein [Saprospiraceae bacterium]